MPEWTPFQNINTETSLDLELLKKEIAKQFPFYDFKYNVKTAVFYCRIDEETLDEKFESLRLSLSEKGYIPMIRYEKGEQVIYVIHKPKIKKRPIWINIVLLIATIITTTIAGSVQWALIYDASWGDIISPYYLANGFIFFSIPLMLILGIHEMGHYLTSKKHKLDASLPYFIPLPPPFILGTFGALISTREPIPNRKTLLDVGVSGPICGFLVAIPVCILGLFLMQQNPILPSTDGETLIITFPLLLQGLGNLFTIPENALMHPTLFAGWVGLFLTSLNLLPVGQLDGGHVARALLKENHKYLGWAVIILVIGLGMLYTGWFMIAIIILLFVGTQHQPPLNEYSALDIRRKILGVLALVIFIICFAPIPMSA
jgi:membrane-associated protease RseP (regulator of RpoE activity)